MIYFVVVAAVGLLTLFVFSISRLYREKIGMLLLGSALLNLLMGFIFAVMAEAVAYSGVEGSLKLYAVYEVVVKSLYFSGMMGIGILLVRFFILKFGRFRNR
jgi:hypothetical protein